MRFSSHSEPCLSRAVVALPFGIDVNYSVHAQLNHSASEWPKPPISRSDLNNFNMSCKHSIKFRVKSRKTRIVNRSSNSDIHAVYEREGKGLSKFEF